MRKAGLASCLSAPVRPISMNQPIRRWIVARLRCRTLTPLKLAYGASGGVQYPEIICRRIRTWPPYRKVGLAVSVVITGSRYVTRDPPIGKSGCSRSIKYPVLSVVAHRSTHTKIGFAVTVVVTRYQNVREQSPIDVLDPEPV